MNRSRALRASLVLAGLLVIVGAVWFAVSLPDQLCKYHFDVGECSDSAGVKLMLEAVGLIVGGGFIFSGARLRS